MLKWYGIWSVVVVVVVVVGVVQLGVIEGQQSYVNNKQLACYNGANNSTTKGFICNGPQTSCQSYLTFRSSTPYNSPTTIGYLLNSDPFLIASLNDLPSDVSTIPTNTLVLVPVNCSCSGNYYQHNATYYLQINQTYFLVANDTYQGLSTCQTLMDQNPYGDKNLTAGLSLHVPLRCACPSSNQTSLGFKYLLTFLVTWGDTISSIAYLFGVNEDSVLAANELSEDSVIYPFTPILVPLTSQPTKIQTPVASPPPADSPESPPPPSPSKSNKWVIVGVTVGASVLLLLALCAFFFFFYRKRKVKGKPDAVLGPKIRSTSADYTAVASNKLWSDSVSSLDVRSAIESLTLYKFEDLQVATGYFGEANRIKGSVYRGSFKGDDAAVKVMKGAVSGEINLLKKINHSNIIRLSGFCIHDGNTYLVYEYAENSSLSDWLHADTKYQTSYSLTWRQRVQIAYDVAEALNYLHNHTNPPYVHKNLKTSNILLDGNMRAKIGNFGLAKMVEDEEQGGIQLTRHVVGTQGYMAPEYVENGVVTTKLDIFAFGVVLLELLSGREAASAKKSKNEGEELLSASIGRVLQAEAGNVREKLRGFMDACLKQEYPLDLAFSMAQLANYCVAHDLNARPSISQVLITLSKILSSSLDWDPSDELDHSRSLSSAR